MKYDAFISYRHAPLDMEIAKKLHKGLETFVIPAAVRKATGKKKIQRVFRDQEELPIGSNLTENIFAALEESEYLIVICSRQTPESEWVAKEIETFISMHDRNHVLAILIDGEPDESFPRQLVVDDEGNTVEPLAADIRGETKQERNKKFSTELLRLAAPVIGCSFDDLRQRHRERMIRRLVIEISALAGAIAVTGTLFGIYNARVAEQMHRLADEKTVLAEDKSRLADEKTRLADEIMQEYQDKQKNQSRFYASASLSLLENGNRRAAALVAAEGLPSPGNDRPYVPEAEYALSSALHAYDDGFYRDYKAVLHHDLIPRSVAKNSSGEYAIIRDSGNNIHFWETDTWEEKLVVTSKPNASNYLVNIKAAECDDEYAYIVTEDSIDKYDFSGNIQWSIELTENPRQAVILPEKELVYVVNSKRITAYYLTDGRQKGIYSSEVPEDFGAKSCYSDEAGILAVAHSDNEEGGNTHITVINVGDDSVCDVEVGDGHILNLITTHNSNIAVLSCRGDFLLAPEVGPMTLDLIKPDGEKLWSYVQDLKIMDLSTFKTNMWARNTGEGDRVMFGVENSLYIYDENDGTFINKTVLADGMQDIIVSKSSTIGFVAYANGDIVPMDLETSYIYDDYTIRTNKEIAEGVGVDNNFIIRVRYNSDLYVIGFNKASDMEMLQERQNALQCIGVCEEGGYYAMSDYLHDKYHFYNASGDDFYQFDIEDYVECTGFLDDKTLLFTGKYIYKIDPVAGKVDTIDIKQAGVTDGASSYTVTKNGHYAVCIGYKKISVMDMIAENVIYELETDTHVGRAVITEDGSRLYISQDDTDMYAIELATDRKIEYMGSRLRQVANIYENRYLVVSPDGKYVAMCCFDGKVRIVDTVRSAFYSEIPIACSDRIYMEFSSDGRRLFMQGDDYMVHIWGLDENEYLGGFEASYEIKYSITAEKNGHLALYDIVNMYLLETDTYSLIAKVPRGVVYLQDDKSFIICNGSGVMRCYYKDYKTLLEEMKVQFGDDKLTQEERLNYNIN